MSLKRFLGTAAAVAVLLALGFFVPLDYYVIRPSRAVDLSEVILVENADPDDRGAFYLVTVTQQKAVPVMAIYSLIHPHFELRPALEVLPKDMEEEEYRLLLNEYMIESQHMAQIVALRRAGFEVEIIGEGVAVVGFLDHAPAEGFLEENDVIIDVDGSRVFLASEVPLIVQDRSVGDEVSLTILRKGRELRLNVPTGSHPDDEDLPFLGVYIQSLPWEPVIPLAIEMKTGRIGGPSAGLMFVLEILNQIIAEDLTAGRNIAGTGTIDFDEKIGRVGGVVQKVVAAEKAGAEYFFVPEGSFDDAQKGARSIEVIPVTELEDVLEFLAALDIN